MATDLGTYPDTPDLLRQALRKSWRRDRFRRGCKLAWRWSVWALTRYGSSVFAAMLMSASTPGLWTGSDTPDVVNDSLKLIPSYQLTPITHPQ